MYPNRLHDRHGCPFHPIGVNYWPRRTAVEMWARWDPEGIAKDLREMRTLGLNTVRFFLMTADFVDAEGNLRSDALEKLDTFLTLCHEQGLMTLPTFFVGHMSGTNFAIPWHQGREFYTDAEVLARSCRFVQAIVARHRDEDAILGWLLSNEITHYAGKRETHVLVGWMRALRDAIRAIDPHRPVAAGDGADDLKGNGLGYPDGTLNDITALAQVQDFISLHIYFGDDDTLRFAHTPAGLVRLCDIGLPVLAEEFGMSTGLVAEEEQAAYFRMLLFSTWTVGAAGHLGWCWSDFATTDLPPYTHHPFELYFGITRADGSEKPVAIEMRRFAWLLERVKAADWTPERPQAAILVPSIFYVNYPFRNVNRSRLFRTLMESYTLARMAGLDVIFAREPAELPEGVRLLLVPYADLQAATWSRLKTWVEAGGVLWTGAAAAVTELAPLFGLRLSRRGGTGRPVAGSELTLRFVASWDDLDIGETLTVPLGESPHLPISPMRQPQAQVLAVDEADRPLLTGHAIGRGRAFFCAYPLEHLLTYGHEPNAWSHAHRLYRALRAEAGIRPTFSASDPALSLSTLNAQNTEGPARLLIAINHSLSPVTAQVFGREPLARVVDVESQTEIAVQDGAFTLTVDPWEVRVLAV